MSAPTRPRRGGARRAIGCGCGSSLLLLLLVSVVVIAGWLLVVQPALRNTAQDELNDALSAQVDTIADDALPPAGTTTVTEAEINRRLRDTVLSETPVSDPTVTITPDGLSLRFTLYGLENTLSGRPVVENGQIRVRDANLSGPAAEILSAAETATLIEEQLDRLLVRADARLTAIDLEPGRLTVTTAPNAEAVARDDHV